MKEYKTNAKDEKVTVIWDYHLLLVNKRGKTDLNEILAPEVVATFKQ
jgi:hypothetical protein